MKEMDWGITEILSCIMKNFRFCSLGNNNISVLFLTSYLLLSVGGNMYTAQYMFWYSFILLFLVLYSVAFFHCICYFTCVNQQTSDILLVIPCLVYLTTTARSM
jgi:hypothetical protein